MTPPPNPPQTRHDAPGRTNAHPVGPDIAGLTIVVHAGDNRPVPAPPAPVYYRIGTRILGDWHWHGTEVKSHTSRAELLRYLRWLTEVGYDGPLKVRTSC